MAEESPSPQAFPAGECDHVLPSTTNCALGGGDGHPVLHYVEAVLQQRTAAEVQNGRELVQKPLNPVGRGFPPPVGVCLAEGQDFFKLAIISRSWGGAPSIGHNPTGGCHDADQGIGPLNLSHGLLEGGVHVQQGGQDAVQPVATVHGLNNMPGGLNQVHASRPREVSYLGQFVGRQGGTPRAEPHRGRLHENRPIERVRLQAQSTNDLTGLGVGLGNPGGAHSPGGLAQGRVHSVRHPHG